MSITPTQANELLRLCLAWKAQGPMERPANLVLLDFINGLEKELEGKTLTRSAPCRCGEGLPWHMAAFAQTRPTVTCSVCGRVYEWGTDLTLHLIKDAQVFAPRTTWQK